LTSEKYEKLAKSEKLKIETITKEKMERKGKKEREVSKGSDESEDDDVTIKKRPLPRKFRKNSGKEKNPESPRLSPLDTPREKETKRGQSFDDTGKNDKNILQVEECPKKADSDGKKGKKVNRMSLDFNRDGKKISDKRLSYDIPRGEEEDAEGELSRVVRL